jgi:hypothetical protein
MLDEGHEAEGITVGTMTGRWCPFVLWLTPDREPVFI